MEDRVPNALLRWYDDHARVLAWRIPPAGTGSPAPKPDPYRVWLSEVMLQQTTTAAVTPYFLKFTERWPTVEALAAASDEEVMAAWAGLGYYSRARNLIACAREVARLGAFPNSEAELLKLPGLGAYTAAAITAIAFGERAVVVDANVERVTARLFAIETPLPAARKDIRAATDRITPDERAGDFAQAMMDLGATVCTSRSPQCLLCPLRTMCQAQSMGDPARLPVKAPKKARPTRQGRAFWIERKGQVWLTTRAKTGMLAAMRALPDDGWAAKEDGSGDAPLPGKWESCGLVRHSFSHFDLELTVMRYAGDNLPGSSAVKGEWWDIARLDEAGLPTLFAKAAARALA